jgi:hypothetical protein
MLTYADLCAEVHLRRDEPEIGDLRGVEAGVLLHLLREPGVLITYLEHLTPHRVKGLVVQPQLLRKRSLEQTVTSQSQRWPHTRVAEGLVH